MCGITGVVKDGPDPGLVEELLDDLELLQYRGYDSAGIAYLENSKLRLHRRAGKNSLRELRKQSAVSACGIGHTRWATHGPATEANAHPHVSGPVAIVHNGIIENFLPIKDRLQADGVKFKSQTDSELIAHLLSREIRLGAEPSRALVRALEKLEGSFAVVAIFADINKNGGLMLATRRKSPLLVGRGKGAAFVASDLAPLAKKADGFYSLEDGQVAELTAGNVVIREQNLAKRRVSYKKTGAEAVADKGKYPHFMLKEIFEQPRAITETLKTAITDLKAKKPNSVTLVACGTSYFAALTSRYWLEGVARLDVRVELASEFRYRRPLVPKDRLFIFISQSGETADTLAAFRYVKQFKCRCLALVNVAHSSLARECEEVVLTKAGPEVGVASTKAFTTQLVALAMITAELAPKTKVSKTATIKALAAAAGKIRGFYDRERIKKFTELGRYLAGKKNLLFLGRGMGYPLALEGALKMNEIAYIHSIAYAAGEMKHGPIALVDRQTPVVMIAPYDKLFTKNMGNMEELLSRRGELILLSDNAEAVKRRHREITIVRMPKSEPFTMPLLYAPALQLLAYYTAAARGTEIDRPRNLAKSVTVE